MNDKEKIKESLELIDDFEKSGVYVSDSHDNARTAKRILREIKEVLEKWLKNKIAIADLEIELDQMYKPKVILAS